MSPVPQSKNTGFTIIELLVVIVVIAILAAISIVAYSGIQNRAKDSVLAQEVAVFEKAVSIKSVDTGRFVCENCETKEQLLAHYAAQSQSDKVVLYTNEVEYEHLDNPESKDKVIIHNVYRPVEDTYAPCSGSTISRWSHQQNQWINVHLREDGRGGVVKTVNLSDELPDNWACVI